MSFTDLLSISFFDKIDRYSKIHVQNNLNTYKIFITLQFNILSSKLNNYEIKSNT